MSNARSKYGVCFAKKMPNDEIKNRKSLGIYGEGSVGIDKIKQEIIPKIDNYFEKNQGTYPVLIYPYFSINKPSKHGFEIIMTKRGLAFEPKKPKSEKKSFDWYINENKKIFDLRKDKH